jgi:hypothetical protein
MKRENGEYDPLIGYLILDQAQRAGNMLGRCPVPVRNIDPQ